MSPKPEIILGVDPGSRITGYAFIRARRLVPRVPGDFEIVEAGALRLAATLPHAQRLGLLHEALHDLIARQKPNVCVMEKAFFDKNVSSALKLGEMRGAYIAACARLGVAVDEITPAEVKKMITGNGRADKELVSMAVRTLMGFDRGSLPHDVTDAVAISLCFGLRLAQRWATAPGSGLKGAAVGLPVRASTAVRP